MPGKFCPKCGNVTNDLYEGFCKDCFLEKADIFGKLPDRIDLAICKKCGTVYMKERDFETLEEAVETFFRELKIREINSISYRISDNRLTATLYFEVGGLKGQAEKKMELRKTKFICKFCNMKFSGYFNSILQIRGNVNFDKIIKETESKVDRFSKLDKLAFISNVIQRREGVDIHLGSKAAANKIGRYLKSRYKAKTKVSRTLHGKKQGKNVYRDTILVLFGE